MKNITYLFGAGASKHALPLVSEFPERINGLIVRLNQQEYISSDTEKFENLDIYKTKKDIYFDLIDDLDWMRVGCIHHASIDTFAKKLLIKGDISNLRRLKIILSAFFIFEQSINYTDPRYDSFLASILKSGIRDFPDQLKILSWNYDYQFEKSYSGYTDKTELIINRTMLNVISKSTYDKNDDNKFGIYKINGTTGFFLRDGFQYFDFLKNIEHKFDKNLIDSVLKSYAEVSIRVHNNPMLSFAWENIERAEHNIIDKCINGTKETNVLIVIGYSLPFFNREIDRKIINAMTSLEKVYFQAPDSNNLKERFLSIREDIDDKKLVLRYDTEQFLLPNEL